MARTKTERIDTQLSKDMRDVMKIRALKGLANLNMREISIAEATRLLRRTNGYKQSLEEMKTKPKSR